MSQNNLVIDNQSFPTTRADINSALQALGSLNSGSSAPTTTYANMLWYDTSANTLKMRSEANDQWINIGYLDQSADAFRIFDDTQVVDSSGTQTGLIGDQATSAWEAGTSTTESLVSPAKVKAAIEDLSFGGGQVWQSVTGSRAFNTSYQNLTGSPIAVAIYASSDNTSSGIGPVTGSLRFQVSTNGSTWVSVSHAFLERTGSGSSYIRSYVGSVVVPKSNYYRLYTTAGNQSLYSWAELR